MRRDPNMASTSPCDQPTRAAAASVDDQSCHENGQAADGEQEVILVPGANLYVRNFGDNLTDDGLKSLFSSFGTITSAVVMTKNGTSRGFGFVNFSKPEDANKALKAMNKKLIDQKPLYVSLAQTKEERREFLAQERERYHRYGTGGGVSPGTASQPSSQVSTPPRASPQTHETIPQQAPNLYLSPTPQAALPQLHPHPHPHPHPQPRLPPPVAPPQHFGGMKKFMLLHSSAGQTLQTGYVFAPAPPLMLTTMQPVYAAGVAAPLHAHILSPAHQTHAGQPVSGMIHPHLHSVGTNPGSVATMQPFHVNQNNHSFLIAQPFASVGTYWHHGH